MKDPLDRLKNAPLRVPSQRLEQRMEALFDEARHRPPSFWARPIALWQCAALALACLLAGAFLHRAATPPPAFESPRYERTVYIVQADPAAMARLVDVPQRDYPFFRDQRDIRISGAEEVTGRTTTEQDAI